MCYICGVLRGAGVNLKEEKHASRDMGNRFLVVGWFSLYANYCQGKPRTPALPLICLPTAVLMLWESCIMPLGSFVSGALPGQGSLVNDVTTLVLLAILFICVVVGPALGVVALDLAHAAKLERQTAAAGERERG